MPEIEKREEKEREISFVENRCAAKMISAFTRNDRSIDFRDALAVFKVNPILPARRDTTRRSGALKLITPINNNNNACARTPARA